MASGIPPGRVGAITQSTTDQQQIKGNLNMRTNLLTTTAAALAAILISTAPSAAQTRTTLDIYVIDVEGGNATLFVTPSGESVLIDTGNVGEGAVRDAERIMAAA